MSRMHMTQPPNPYAQPAPQPNNSFVQYQAVNAAPQNQYLGHNLFGQQEQARQAELEVQLARDLAHGGTPLGIRTSLPYNNTRKKDSVGKQLLNREELNKTLLKEKK